MRTSILAVTLFAAVVAVPPSTHADTSSDAILAAVSAIDAAREAHQESFDEALSSGTPLILLMNVDICLLKARVILTSDQSYQGCLMALMHLATAVNMAVAMDSTETLAIIGTVVTAIGNVAQEESQFIYEMLKSGEGLTQTQFIMLQSSIVTWSHVTALASALTSEIQSDITSIVSQS